MRCRAPVFSLWGWDEDRYKGFALHRQHSHCSHISAQSCFLCRLCAAAILRLRTAGIVPLPLPLLPLVPPCELLAGPLQDVQEAHSVLPGVSALLSNTFGTIRAGQPRQTTPSFSLIDGIDRQSYHPIASRCMETLLVNEYRSHKCKQC